MDMRLPHGIRSTLAEQHPPLRLLQRWQPKPAAPVAAVAPAAATSAAVTSATTSWRTRLQRLLGR